MTTTQCPLCHGVGWTLGVVEADPDALDLIDCPHPECTAPRHPLLRFHVAAANLDAVEREEGWRISWLGRTEI